MRGDRASGDIRFTCPTTVPRTALACPDDHHLLGLHGSIRPHLFLLQHRRRQRRNRGSSSAAARRTVTVTGTLGLSPTTQSFNAIGGAGSVGVNASGGCSWTAASNTAWITITSGGQSSGNATVQYSVSPNSTTATRTGTLTIAGQSFTVSQAGNSSSCTFALSQLSQAFTTGGGYGNVSVRTPGGCVWTAVSPSPWITIASGSSGSGDGAVDFSVAANAGPISRAAILGVAGQSFSVIQAERAGRA